MISLLALTLSAAAQSTPSFTTSDHDIAGEWIYRKNNCLNDANGWHHEKLFQENTGPLSNYCRATYVGSGEPPVPTNFPPNARPDRVALAPMSATDTSLKQHARSRTGPMYNLPALSHPPARVAILDSIPDGVLNNTYFGATPEFSDHGARLAVLNRRLLCDSSVATNCAAEQHAYLALGWRVNAQGQKTRNPTSGGGIGSQADLALRIYDAVSDWEAAPTATTGPLVINLSLGWHPEMGGTGHPSSFDPPVKAVYDALRYASCKGALVLAASGNLQSELDAPQPLYPAAWESVSAPAPANCSALFGTNGDNIGTATYTPLIFGVGGVNGDREPLGVSRPNSLPAHLAAGSHLALNNGVTGTVIKPISGTSVSTAVVSAAAAVVRAYRPNLTAPETMAVLRAGAQEESWTLPSPPEWPNTSPLQEMSVISVCHSLIEACEGGTYCTVATPGHCTPDPALVPLSIPAPTQTPKTWELDFSVTSTCEDSMDADTAVPDDYVESPNLYSECPTQDQVGTASLPMTLPMPPIDPCQPHCNMDITGSVPVVDIPLGPDADLDAASIVVKIKSTGEVRTAAVGKLIGNTTYVLEETDGQLIPNGETVSSAYLSYIYEGKIVVNSEEMVIID